MTRCLRHFGIVVKDLDRALEFYCGKLGLSVSRRMEESGAFLDAVLAAPGTRVTTVKLAAEEGPTLLELLHFEAPKPGEAEMPSLFRTGVTHFALTVDDLNTLHESLSAGGTPFLSEPRKSPDGLAFVAFCRDPEGNLIELVEPSAE
ncbi:MAG: VOC family protein [Chthoniobacterales bacterium]|nr:VOC family protein [Chthoniobacterales bacterium]